MLLLYYLYWLYMYMYVCMFLCVSIVNSPYLLVVGDDRVRGTLEQVMMQVELVRLSDGEGMTMGSFS